MYVPMQPADVMGETTDLEQEIWRHSEGLVRYAWACTGSRSLAQDVAQSTLTTALEELRKGRRPDHLRAWLYGIAHHAVCASKKREGRDRRVAQRVSENEPRADSAPEENPFVSEVREALSELPKPYGPIVGLRFVQGLSVDEIAQAAGMNPGTVKVYVWRGLAILRARFGSKLTELRKKSS